ncbi:MAG TPA: PDZ domain-containing protein, partial [Terriglobia bacterium]|nr:PDZ domain-containing protein [Terriglobia bacterium]
MQAQLVLQDGPADRAGIQPGDTLLAINGHPVQTDRQVTEILYDIGPWNPATYTINRAGSEFKSTMIVAGPSLHLKRQRLFLEIIGLFYFLVGILVLIRRYRAPQAVHFYFVCLVSFVLFVYSFTGKLNSFDWTIFWLDLAASALLPPMFLHFCLEFPLRKNWLKQNKKLLALLYAPGLLVLGVWFLFVNGILEVFPSPVDFRNFLETISDVHLGVYFALSAGILLRTYRTVQEPELRQQMKWVTRGTALSVLPYF